MYTPVKRMRRVTRHEWSLAVPATAKDLGDTIRVATNEMQDLGIDISYDDAFHVTVGDEEVVLWVQIEEEA